MFRQLSKIAMWKKRVKPSDLDALIDRVNILSKITGSGGTVITTGPTGINIKGGGVGDTNIKMAQLTESAGANSIVSTSLTANLMDNTGTETSISIEIWTNVADRGTDVDWNAVLPRLVDDDRILVVKLQNKWWWLTTPQASEDCVCS